MYTVLFFQRDSNIYEKEALNNLILSLKTKWPTANFKIFGSKVKGIADKESDIDLL